MQDKIYEEKPHQQLDKDGNLRKKLEDVQFQQMFRAFDLNGNLKLSLPEIAVGMAKIMDGTDDERLLFAFRYAFIEAVLYFN